MNTRQRKILSTYFPELQVYTEKNESVPDSVLVALINKIDTLRGEDGYTPIKGKDYFTKEELGQILTYLKDKYITAEILEKSTPIKGVHYRDGKDGQDGKPGEKGDPGEIGPEGKPGKDGSPDSPMAIVSKLNTLSRVLKSDVIDGLITKKDLQFIDKKISDGMARVDGRIKLIDQRWHGGLSFVTTDSTLTGRGTPASPLSVAAGSGFITLTGSINGTNVTFTAASRPTLIFTDIGVWAENATAGFTYSAGTITLPFAPNYWAKAL